MPQRLAKASAQPQADPGLHNNAILTIIHELQAADPIHVDDRGAVDATERPRLQLSLQGCEQQVRVGSNVQPGVIVRGLDPVDLGNANEHDLPCVLDDERLCGAWSPLPVMTQRLFGSRVTVRLRVTTPTRPVPRRRGTPIQLCGPSLIEQMTSAPTTHPGLTFRSIT